MDPKITVSHLQRLACLYVRQSTLQQVLENRESTARQYALQEQASGLGWSEEHIMIIDQDLGQSGVSAADRAGFQRLVAEVGLGHVGLVMGLEVSRLARSSSDWHQLLEICALTGTLILDEDGLYDPATFNDRLLLGLKGTMSEAELYVLRARLQGGILNKAQRGALKLHLPIGFRYSDVDQIILDPHQQVQTTLHFLFRTFQQTGTASATVRVFRQQHIAFPRRVRSGPHQDELVWGELRHDDVLRVLHNPCYAGAYVFGRTRTRKGPDGKTHIAQVPKEEWQVVLQEAHVGYISWEEYERNLEQLKANSRAYTPARLSPPREGPALLQSLAICGRCGQRMTVRYHQRGGARIDPDYICQRTGIEQGEGPCQRIPGRDVDRAVSRYLLEALTPEAVAVTLAIHDELLTRAAEVDRLRQLQVKRTQYEADLAQRRYLRVDPDNRLVAEVLETEWNAKLLELDLARQEAERQRQHDTLQLSAVERDRLAQTPTLFRQVWNDPQLTSRERKRILRLMIEDVTLLKEADICAGIRFKGGATCTLHVPLPRPFAQSRTTPAETIAAIDRLLDDYTDAEIAAELNRQNMTTLGNLPFTATHISALRRTYHLPNRFSRLREVGWQTADEVAVRFEVTPQTVWRWYHQGLIQGSRYNDRGGCLFMAPETRPFRFRRPRTATSYSKRK